MLCPIDQTELVISERQGVEIDYCPKCRGVWLDRGELYLENGNVVYVCAPGPLWSDSPDRGLYTAIVAGSVVALLGGSKHQVTGPTAAFVVILAPTVELVAAAFLVVAPGHDLDGALLGGRGLAGFWIRPRSHDDLTGLLSSRSL